MAALPLVHVLPLASREDTWEAACFGAGVATLLRRDLMLVRDLSVHGPEDTPRLSREGVEEHPGLVERHHVLTGRVRRGAGGDGPYRASVELWAPGGQGSTFSVEAHGLNDFLFALAERAASALGGHVTDETRRAWRFGRPAGAQSLERLGAFALVEPPESPPPEEVLALRRDDPSLGVAVQFLDDEHPEYLRHLLAANEADPYCAQLYFSLFIATWDGTRREQPEAVQFLRRGLELSPGHGKMHMCAPHAASHAVDMLGHAELGYTLLPGNSFAVSNYINALCRSRSADPERLVALSRETIDADPESPDGYLQAIHALRHAGQPARALPFAQELRELYGPPMPERTRYCIEQNPQRKEALRSGSYDPLAEVEQLIRELKKEAGQKG